MAFATVVDGSPVINRAILLAPGKTLRLLLEYIDAISFIARQELEKDNIIVSLVLPGMTASNFYANMIGGMPDFGSRKLPPMDSNEKVAGKIAEIIESGEAELEI